MAAYALRRLLIMIPTFFGISLVIFLILNLAPGRPGAQQAGDNATDVRGVGSQESYRIFREQFALEKPTLFNTRFTLDVATIAYKVRLLSRQVAGTEAERIRAQDELEDYGAFAVPHLIQLLKTADAASDTLLRDTTVRVLRLAAIRLLEDPYNPNPAADLRARNREIDQENSELRTWGFAASSDEVTKQQVLNNWYRWYEAHAERFQFSTAEKVRIFFLDTRFATYWKNLARLDFGVSLVSRERVMTTLLNKLPYSLSMSVGSLLLAYALAIPLGIFSAVRKNTTADRVTTVVLFMLYSLPTFFVATMLLVLFSQGSPWPALRIFPTGGWQSSDAADLTLLERARDISWHLVLPILCMTYGLVAALSRYMRSGLLEVIRSDYVRTARAKGLPESIVVGKHALRNGLLPILTLLAGLLPAALGGSVIVEYIFGIPGMGLWMVESIYQRDYNVIMAVQLLTTLLVLVGVLFTDLSYALVDPRIRYS